MEPDTIAGISNDSSDELTVFLDKPSDVVILKIIFHLGSP